MVGLAPLLFFGYEVLSMKHTISALVENEFGVLARIAGLFSGRGYNIQSLTVAETLNPAISRMTIVTSGDDAKIEQILKQLRKLINVIKAQDVTGENPITRILSLVKVKIGKKNRGEAEKVVKGLNGKILEADSQCLIAEFTGDETAINSVQNLLQPFGILEFEQTGTIAIERGKKVITAS